MEALASCVRTTALRRKLAWIFLTSQLPIVIGILNRKKRSRQSARRLRNCQRHSDRRGLLRESRIRSAWLDQIQQVDCDIGGKLTFISRSFLSDDYQIGNKQILFNQLGQGVWRQVHEVGHDQRGQVSKESLAETETG